MTAEIPVLEEKHRRTFLLRVGRRPDRETKIDELGGLRRNWRRHRIGGAHRERRPLPVDRLGRTHEKSRRLAARHKETRGFELSDRLSRGRTQCAIHSLSLNAMTSGDSAG